MTKRLLRVDPATGLQTWHDYDSLTDKTTIGYAADSSAILEVNKAMQNDVDFSKKGIKDEFWMYAQIPVAVQVDWLINKGVDVYNRDHAKKVFELVNDPEYRHLKTTAGYHQPKKYG